ATLAASRRLAGAAAAFGALAPNTTFQARVRAVNSNGVPTAFVSGGSTATAAATPAAAGAAFTAVGVSSVTAAWAAGGNRPGTVFEAQVSSDSFATVNESSATAALSAGFEGLAGAASYAFRVRALGVDGAPSAFLSLGATTTLTPPVGLSLPGDAATAFPAVGLSSVAAAWASGGNGAGALYEAQLSSDSFATVNVSSVTAGLSAVFGTGGEGPALDLNRGYSVRVRASSGAVTTGFNPLGSVFTLADAPASAALAALGTSSATLSWGANGNPASTRYEAQLSTDAFASLNASSLTYGTSAVFTGLAQNTTHHLRVRALNGAASPSAFDSAVTTPTLAAAPIDPALSAVGASSVTASWGANSNPSSTLWTVQLSTDSFVTLNLDLPTPAVSLALGTGGSGPALTPNTTYYLRVAALSRSGIPSASVTATTASTLAEVPSGAALSSVHFTSAALSWSANGNPAGT
ncbi:MAG: cell wall surface anchor family protein, partial [Elusimicrobia bacterium]